MERFLLLLLYLPFLADLATGDDKDVRVFLRRAGLLALARGLAPHGLRALHTPALLAFASAVRMVNRAHHRSADGRADAEPARAPRLADDDEI